jgi:N-acetylglucosaminyl-diphospho-decaprenol L-rhamnosyltransferase
MTTTVAIVNWNSGNLLRSCVQSVLMTSADAEVVVVDNASRDNSVESITEFRDRVDLVQNSVNRGFAGAVNQAFQQSSSPYVLILNPDIRVPAGAIELLENFLNVHPRAGAAGGYVNDKYLPRNFPTAAAVARENLGFRKNHSYGHAPVAVDQPAAAALIVRRDAYDEVGGFDEQFFPAWYEDVDFCQRLKARGWDIYFVPDAKFQHDGGYAAELLGARAFAEAYYRNQLRYAKKHFAKSGRFSVRASIAVGMIARLVTRPANARAYVGVLRGVLGRW